MTSPNHNAAMAERRSGLGYAALPPERRHYDTRLGKHLVKIVAGEHYFTGRPDEVIVTILGSCVAACIRDPVAAVGGMNHFMLPQGRGATDAADSFAAMHYGNVAMERLINDLLKAGAQRDRLEVKVFGGGNVIRSSQPIGTQNAEFVRRYLAKEGFKIAAQDLEGVRSRRIQFDPASGEVRRFWLNRSDENVDIAKAEQAYQRTLEPRAEVGSVELFD